MTISAPAAAVSKEQLPASLRYIAETLEGHGRLKPSQMRRIVLDARVELVDIEPWANFDHPPQDSYGRRLVYQGDRFEIMVMSWCPGDFSTIHDHGYTQYGAVQVFGPAEHATFRIDEDHIHTLSRWIMEPGEVIGVHHDLLHQMGNSTADQPFLTLHVYGDLEPVENVTGNARVLDLEKERILRVDGGVFFALPEKDIKKQEAGPKPDFPTRLRHLIELARRLRNMGDSDMADANGRLAEVIRQIEDPAQRASLRGMLDRITDTHQHQTNSVLWRVLNWELKEMAKLQDELTSDFRGDDHFNQYAELYDALIGRPCLEGFMKDYLAFFFKEKKVNPKRIDFISLGCGTGLVEAYLIKTVGIPNKRLFGLDLSEAMVKVANERIRAETGDVLTLDPSVKMWDVAYSGLNVFHYINHEELEQAISRTAAILRPGGYFVGDFITPDHIRWYPNVMISDDEQIISLRNPRLVEEEGAMFQESEITNISFQHSRMRVTYAGKHRRFLPPLHRVRTYFESYFGGPVELYDAVSLKPISAWADSCASTRYIVIAQKR